LIAIEMIVPPMAEVLVRNCSTLMTMPATSSPTPSVHAHGLRVQKP
jgi:hypothetical protein